MKNRHVNDFEIQQYTFEQEACEPAIIKHIQSCEACKKNVEAYLSLSTTLKEQPAPTLDYDLAALVLEQLPSPKVPESTNNYLINFMVLVSIGLAISTFYLFKDTLHYLLSDRLIQRNYFFLSVAVFISIVLIIDLFRSFNKKINMLEI